ncbi:MAG: MarR family winged helix-turn-helix transcriptional regulator [Rhizobiaceae bacterium]
MPSQKQVFRNYVNRRLERLAQTARETADQVYRRECGIDIQRIRILRIVSAVPGQPVNSVVRESDFDRTLVSRIITDLVKRGFLSRTISPEDARQFLLTTTPAGEDLVTRANVLGDALNEDLLGVLDRDELEIFERCLAKLAQWQPSKWL